MKCKIHGTELMRGLVGNLYCLECIQLPSKTPPRSYSREEVIDFTEWLDGCYTSVEPGVWVWYDEVEWSPIAQKRFSTPNYWQNTNNLKRKGYENRI